jgi:hypothetical protein
MLRQWLQASDFFAVAAELFLKSNRLEQRDALLQLSAAVELAVESGVFKPGPKYALMPLPDQVG